MKEAKKLGTLVVSVCADQHVKKGLNRPIFNQDKRLEIIEALEFVDYVIINDAPDCSELIGLLKPEILVKGEEYKNKSTSQLRSELDSLQLYGGRLHFLTTQFASSSNLINDYMSNLSEEANLFLREFKKKHSFAEIQDEIEKLKDISAVLLGETIIDEYSHGDVIGKSSKNPAMVLSLRNSQTYAGGAIAIANHLAAFCGTVQIITYLGEDEIYEEFIQSKLQSNVELKFIRKQNSPTIVKTRFIDSYYKTRLFETYEINDSLLSPKNEQQLLELLPDSGDLIIADFGHGLITPKMIREFYRRYNHLCVNVQCNAGNNGYNFLSKYHDGMYYASIDINELRLLMRDKYEKIDRLAIDCFEYDYSPMFLSVTLGKEGASLYNSFTRNQHHCPAMTTKVTDTIGSGDTAFAIASLLMLNKCNIELVPFIANIAAGIACSIIGNERPITKQELLENIEVLLK